VSGRSLPRLGLLGLLCAAVVVIAPFVGMELILPAQITTQSFEQYVFFTLRVPRVLVAFLAGGGLAVCGMVFQAIFRNPLATPYTLGVSSGASFGAALCILTGLSVHTGIPGLGATEVGAFLGASAAMLIVYGFSTIQRVGSSLTILLAGVAVSFLFGSLLMFVQFLSGLRHSFQIVRWLMGGLEVFGYSSLYSMLPFLCIGVVIVAWHLPELNLLLTGEDLAATRGVNVRRVKIVLYFATSLAVSAIVAVCGPIGFVGMMSPHICRLLFSNDHRVLGPASFLFGGMFLVACDTFARTIIAPAEIPVGVITALCGGPFFLWILFGRGRRGLNIFR
jgi:iron complex transport system permease protein